MNIVKALGMRTIICIVSLLFGSISYAQVAYHPISYNGVCSYYTEQYKTLGDTLYLDTLAYRRIDYAQKEHHKKRMPTDSTDFYRYGIGLIINNLGEGFSVKYGISKNFVGQTNLSGRFFANKYSKDESFLLYIFELSQDFLFQKKYMEKNGVTYYYMIGGGASGGITILRSHLWKVGAYPLVGMEFVLNKAHLSFQVDLRAGYSALLKSANARPPRTDLSNNPLWLFCYAGAPVSYPYHGYDISVNFTIKYCKIK